MEGVNLNIIGNSALKGKLGDALKQEKVHKAAVEFESMFITEMLQPVFDMQEVDEYFGGGHGEEQFRGMLVEQYGKEIAKRGGVGIAKSVERELMKLQEVNYGNH